MKTALKTTITVEVEINAPIEKIWDCWTNPVHIIHWNFASNDWCAPNATNDLKPGGKFSFRMEAKDGSMGFDFEGEYIAVKLFEHIEYAIIDGRNVKIDFVKQDNKCSVIETFEAEDENSIELQREGWQAILNNFKGYVEKST